MAGVVVITTKRGQAGVSRINYTGEFISRLKPNAYNDFNIQWIRRNRWVFTMNGRKGWLDLL